MRHRNAAVVTVLNPLVWPCPPPRRDLRRVRGVEGEVVRALLLGSSPFRKGMVMSKRATLLAVLSMVLVVVPAPLAGAKQPLDVEMEVTLSTLSFEASGPAVDAGLMCEGGTMIPLMEKYAGASDIVANLQVVAEFTCDDGGGLDGDTFIIKQQLHIDLTADPVSWTFSWVIKDGTGALSELHGNGDGTGVLLEGPPFGPFDVLVGQLH